MALAPHSTRMLRLTAWPPTHLDDLGWPNLNNFDVHLYWQQVAEWINVNKHFAHPMFGFTAQQDMIESKTISLEHPSLFPVPMT